MSTGTYIEPANAVKVEDTGDGRTAVAFRTDKGITGAVVDPTLLSELAANILKHVQAGAEAAAKAGEQPPGEFAAFPVEATGLGYSPDENNPGGYIHVKLGELTLTIRCEEAMLQGLAGALPQAGS